MKTIANASLYTGDFVLYFFIPSHYKQIGMATQRKVNRHAGVKCKHITAIPGTGWTEVLLTLPSVKMEKANQDTTKFSGLNK